MGLFVGRLPLFAFADLTVTAGLLIILGAIVWLRHGSESLVVRGALTGAFVIALLSGPLVVDLMTRAPLAVAANHGRYIDPPGFLFWIPTIGSVLALLLAVLLIPARDSARRRARYQISFVAILFAFVLLNFVNWCSPVWCERYGFPFPYRWWSDAVVILNGENRSAGSSVVAAAANVVVACGISGLLAWRYRRKGQRS